MTSASAARLDDRILLLAPTGRDGQLVQQMLADAGIQSDPCPTLEELCSKAALGAGAVFIAEEALSATGVGALAQLIDQQPPWSDIPIIISTGPGAITQARVRTLDALGASGNVVILERPVRILTMVVTIQSALRARRRQYQMRNLSAQIEYERAKLEALIMQMPVAICILEGPELRVSVANASYLAIARAGEEIIGRRIADVFPHYAASERFAKAKRVYETGQPCDIPEFSSIVDGAEERFFQANYRALRDQAGRIGGLIITTTELTDQVRARQALELSRAEADAALAAAESASRAKDEFLAMLGHELRNPLAPIITALQLMRLADGKETKERAIIERQARHMAALVDDLLDVSRITQAKIELKRSVLDLAELIGNAIETAAPVLEKRQHQLIARIEPDTYFVNGDPERLAQVFSNILTNAAKYTDDGGRITIEASLADGFVTVRIADTGRGISPQMLPHIFELFAQEHQNLDRAQGGLGLGLAIVKSLVEMHGGKVSAQSDGAGHGSAFVVTLPAAARPHGPISFSTGSSRERHAAREAARLLQSRAQPPRILVVDDNRDAAEMLADAVRMMGYTAFVAHDGPAALALARGGEPPTAAFLDIGLPVMDGYELAHRLRDLPGWRFVSLVAVTGYGQDRDRRQSLEAGFDVHLVKPIALSQLRKALENIGAREG